MNQSAIVPRENAAGIRRSTPEDNQHLPRISGAIGAIVVQDLEKEKRFDQNDLRTLIALSSQVAGAINNIRLLEDARRFPESH